MVYLADRLACHGGAIVEVTLGHVLILHLSPHHVHGNLLHRDGNHKE
jgi:hypothetical protein